MSAWDTTNDRIRLYHGCMWDDAVKIGNTGVDTTKGRSRTDFGQGFYLTTSVHQANDWAVTKVKRAILRKEPSSPATVIIFVVPWEQLALLESIVFVVPDQERYWPLVKHCRANPPGTHRIVPKPLWYDLAVGPVARRWQGDEREVNPDFDQYSFHTDKAVTVLATVMASGSPHFTYKKI